MAFADFQWAPPRDWQKLERLCHLLWRKIWNDPSAQLNGRPGQQQHGVDIFGIPAGAARVHGIQCKRKDALLHTLLTEDEVRAEVENAKGFKPPLEELLIVTCAPSDVGLQAVARQITEEHATRGLFRVHVLGWTEVLDRMAGHPELIAQVYGLTPITEAPRDSGGSARSEAQHAEIIAGQSNIQQQLVHLTAQMAAPAEGPAHAKLDLCRDLLQDHSYRAALRLLETLRAQEWEAASANVRFRIATNLGAAHLGMGEYAEAGQWFLQAFEFETASERSLSNRALGLFLLNRRTEALTAAREAIDAHPLSARAWGAYLNVLSRVEPESPIPGLPEALENDPDVLLVQGDALAMRRRWSEAETVLRRLIGLPKFDVLAKSRLAEVILTQITGGHLYGGVPYSPTERVLLNEARDLFAETWNAVKHTDRAGSALHVVQNWCGLCAILGQFSSIEPVIDEALAAGPDDSGLLVWKIRIAAERGDGATALRMLAKLSPATVEQYAFVAAIAHRAAKDLPRALELLEQYLRSGPDPEAGADARCLFADLVCESDPTHAEARFNALPAAGTPQVARATAIFARALREAGQLEASGRHLAVARETLAGSPHVRDRLILADMLAQFGQYEAAVAIYETTVSVGTDTPSLREYIRSLFELDQRRRLTELLASLPEELSRKAHYEWVRANLSLRTGDYAAARTALERSLGIESGNFSARLVWAEVCIFLGDPKPARDWLATLDIRSGTLTLDHLLRVGRLFHALEGSEQAAATFYEALRRFPHDPRSHLAFCSSVLFKGSEAWLPNTRVLAENNTAVRLRNADGREHTYVLEDRPDGDLQSDEIAVSSEFGTRLLGRKVGETVMGHASEFAVHESTVTSIEHKYLHALHTSLEAFNTRFPEHPGLVGVKIPLAGTAEERLAPILRSLKEKSAYIQQIEAMLEQGMPIAGLGTMMGRTSVEAWRGLTGRPTRPVRVCLGNQEEREAAFALIKGKKHRFLLDPIALMELNMLKALDAAKLTLGHVGVVQATLDELRGMMSELDLHPEGYMTMFEQGGQYFRHELTAGAVAQDRQSLVSLLEWARLHCELVPAVPAVDPRPEIISGLDGGVGHAVSDTLLAAQGGEFVLVSDDFNLRALAKNEFGIPGVWIQAVLMAALEAKNLSPDRYNRAVVLLAAWRHEFTSVNGQQLLFEANRGRWRVTPEFEALASTLPLNRSDVRSHVPVCFWFLKELWRKGRGPTKPQATKLTHALLRAVDPARSESSDVFFRELYVAAQRGWLPGRAWQAIAEWCQSQGIRWGFI